MIDAGFAANGGIYLRKQRGRYLDERNAALIARCHKARQVANDASSQCNNSLFLFSFLLHQPVYDLLETGKRFARFTRWNSENLWNKASFFERGQEWLTIQCAYRAIGYDKQAFWQFIRAQCRWQMAQTAPFDYGLRGRAKQRLRDDLARRVRWCQVAR